MDAIGSGNQWPILKTQGSGANPIWETLLFFYSSNIVLAEANTERSTQSLSPIKIKEFYVPYSATITVYLELAAYGSSIAKIYINGQPVGTLRSTGGWNKTYYSFSENISVSEGDLVQLYCWTGHPEHVTYVRNFRLRVPSNGRVATVNLD